MRNLRPFAVAILALALFLVLSCSKSKVSDVPPPSVTLTPWPPDGMTNLGNQIILRWQPDDTVNGGLSYDVYFGTDSTPPKVSTSQQSTSYVLDTLEHQITYYWRVDARCNGSDPEIGPTWSFATMNMPPYFQTNILPANESTGVTRMTEIAWEDIDMEDNVDCDFYWGTNPDPPLYKPHIFPSNLYTDWCMQLKAINILGQIYSMQKAYRQQYGSYCLDGICADRYQEYYVNRLNISIPTDNPYFYCIAVRGDTFWCTATANLDDDAEQDTWVIDQDSILSNTMDDARIPFRPNTTYYWKVVARDGHNSEVFSPIWRFTTGDQ